MMKHSTIMAFIAGMLTVTVGSVAAQQAGSLLFPDVLPDAYFFHAVQRFARQGIVNGYKNGLFGANDGVTRGQMAVVLDRYDTNVIAPLRAQIDELRRQAGMGFCGDGVTQSGETCDDGNGVSGDGCSRECIAEVTCAGGYTEGQMFPAPDGCNTCTCTAGGVSCTKRACVSKKCFSSSECGTGEHCSVDDGDCRYPCPQGVVCIQSCAGVCVEGARTAQCGNGVCEDTESAVAGRAGSAFCPQDCLNSGPACGNALCEEGEQDVYHVADTGPVLMRRGTCPQDCEGGFTACQQQKRGIDAQFEQKRSCTQDADCIVFSRGCSPYQTCGKAVRRDAILQITAAVIDYAEACGSSEPEMCAGCLPSEAVCLNGTCVMQDAN